MLDIQQNVSLRSHSTMRLGGNARYLAEVATRQDLAEAVQWAAQRQLPVIMIGTGSNIIWQDAGYPGLVLVNQIMGLDVTNQDSENLYLTVGAGEPWDGVVAHTVEMGYSGIEQLSLIPGTAGATPVQNVGAYGREISDVLVSVEAYDTQAGKIVMLRGDECGFGYRASRFKGTDKGRFFITTITLHLTKQNPTPPFYASLQAYFDQHSVTTYTPQAVRSAVIAIRSAKLPDPAQVANNGSFFHNPIIDQARLAELQNSHPTIPYWHTDDGQVKLSAAWLLEQAGFKNFKDTQTGMATWPQQPLVLVNEHAQSTADLLKFKQKIIQAVQGKFGITLTQEPEIL